MSGHKKPPPIITPGLWTETKGPPCCYWVTFTSVYHFLSDKPSTNATLALLQRISDVIGWGSSEQPSFESRRWNRIPVWPRHRINMWCLVFPPETPAILVLKNKDRCLASDKKYLITAMLWRRTMIQECARLPGRWHQGAQDNGDRKQEVPAGAPRYYIWQYARGTSPRERCTFLHSWTRQGPNLS